MAATPYTNLPEGFRRDPDLGAVYDSNPTSADDLTIIRGIDTREAAGLNQLGIYFYEQIAGWTDSQVVAVADAMGTSAASIFRDRWTTQALILSTPSADESDAWKLSPSAPSLPASGSRTITLLVAALLVGCFFVTWLNRHRQPPMQGVLAAEITSLRVPADGRLLASHVTVGDEVFTGEVLMTLEKSEHLQQIASQSLRVRQLNEDLQKAEAQASIELQWRNQQLQQELSDVQRRARYFQTMQLPPAEADLSQSAPQPAERRIRTVSRPQKVLTSREQRVNGLLFINGISGNTTHRRSAPRSASADGVRRAVPDYRTSGELLRLEAANVQSRLEQLERLRTTLPTQIRMAAGVENLRAQLEDAEARLTHMQSLSRETSILCPGYGTVGQVRYDNGDRVSRGDVLVRILHTERCYVMVQAPSQRIGELQPGTHVDVLFPDHDRCEGIVAGLPVIADNPLAGGTSMAAVRVESIGRHWPELPVGSAVQVQVD